MSTIADFDVAIIGAGIVGLACASRLAADGKRVVVLDRHTTFGEETSSRNSGVIHAGLYYPSDSLKARACVEGRNLLYERCQRFGIAHRRTGKLIVATDASQLERLSKLQEQALRNEAGAVRFVTASELTQLEPQVRAIEALFSPETGIVDVHELMYHHKLLATAAGATFSFRSQVVGLGRNNDSWGMDVQPATGEHFQITAQFVINSAGLHAEQIAQLAGIDTHALGLRLHWCKGDYFSISARHRGLVQRLIYPLPSEAGLGVHVTLNLAGDLSAGPDTEYIEAIRYDVQPAKCAAFAHAVRQYLPAVSEEDLQPGYAGIRPKLQGPGESFRDFVVKDHSTDGAPGFIGLFGIESPGLTASEALSAQVAALIDEAT